MIGTAFSNNSILQRYDPSPTEHSPNLVNSGNIKKYVDDTALELKHYADYSLLSFLYVFNAEAVVSSPVVLDYDSSQDMISFPVEFTSYFADTETISVSRCNVL